MQSDSTAGGTAPNHPLARRMAVIAFLAQTTSFACVFGSFGVLLTAVEARLGASREASSLGIALVSVASALLAPAAGALAGRVSIRLLMILGAAMGAAGWATIALVPTTAAYLIAYGALIGPGVCLSGAVLPSTLVTRWFEAGRGRALGFVHMPILLVAAPVATHALLGSRGIVAVYLALAAAMALTIVPMLFIVDRPPAGAAAIAGAGAAPALDAAPTAGALVRRPLFWALTLPTAIVFAGAAMLSAHLVPMVADWGIDAGEAAGLLTVTSALGVVAALLFGWIGDRLGGRWALAIVCIDSLVLYALLVLRPGDVTVLAAILVLVGAHGAAALPCFGMAVSQHFGGAAFARAFGLGNLAFMPFTFGVVPIAAAVFVRTGSYRLALIGEVAALAVAAAIAVVTALRARPLAPAPA